MKIAILMTCHNRQAMTVGCLDRLWSEAQSALGAGVCLIKVFLVDDGSTDETCLSIREWCRENALDLRLIAGDGNLFWAKGMRKAWDAAVADGEWDFYLWLNDDVILKTGAMEGVLQDWRRCGDARGVIVGACSEDEREDSCSYGAMDLNGKLLWPTGVAPQRAAGWFNGNFVLIPQETFEIVGKISDEYSHAKADYDYAERLRLAGIPFFSSSQYVGFCRNDWRDKVTGLSVWDRLEMLWRPGYYNLHDLFVFRKTYYGVSRALASCVHLVILAVSGTGMPKKGRR